LRKSETEHVAVIRAVAEGQLKQGGAARQLGLPDQQWRLFAPYAEARSTGLTAQHRGRAPVHQLPALPRAAALVHQKLVEDGYRVSKATVR